MALLYKLVFGRKKSKLNQILMIGSLNECNRLRKAREATSGTKASAGWHDVILADIGDKPRAHKSCTIGGNKDNSNRPRVIGEKLNGWVSKNGFNPHT